jgi:hypothetical protein
MVTLDFGNLTSEFYFEAMCLSIFVCILKNFDHFMEFSTIMANFQQSSNFTIWDSALPFSKSAQHLRTWPRGSPQIAAEMGRSREQLYRSFSREGNPTLRTRWW